MRLRTNGAKLVLLLVFWSLLGAAASGQDQKVLRGEDQPGLSSPPASVGVTFDEPDVVLTNLGNSRISSLCGFFFYRTPRGRLQRTRWSTSWADPLSLDEKGLDPGETYRFFPRRQRVQRDRFLEYEDFFVTGVVYSSGAVDGVDGQFCRERMADTARAARMYVAELRLTLRHDPERFRGLLLSERAAFPGAVAQRTHLILQQLLLAEDGEPIGDLAQRLDQMLDRLARY